LDGLLYQKQHIELILAKTKGEIDRLTKLKQIINTRESKKEEEEKTYLKNEEI
jgi:hypothetical protein